MNKIATGLEGLDEVLNGGLIKNKAYLVKGGPGMGKSTIGRHFLEYGAHQGQETLYITLGESSSQIKTDASKVGIDLTEVSFLDLSPSQDLSENSSSYNVFSPSEVEQETVLESIINKVEAQNPDRVFLDSFTMLQLLNRDAYQMRKMAVSFVKFICSHNATLLMTSEHLDDNSQDDVTFWVDGIIELTKGENWQKLSVSKYRGSDFLKGKHSYNRTGDGITVFPQLRPNKYSRQFKNEQFSSGVSEIDQLLNGGIEKGTTNLIIGATGVGKTNLGLQFLKQAALRNQRSAIYTFEESEELIIRRSEMIGTPIKEMIQSGNLKIMPIEPLSYSPDEFAKIVRTDVEENNTRIVMIDSIGGYSLAINEENRLERLHSLTVYLQNMGVTTLLINESQNITGEFTTTNMNASYLADNIIFLRYLELNGKMQKAIGVLKKRLSGFENFIREFEITSDGVKVGKPLENMRGILSGLPESLG